MRNPIKNHPNDKIEILIRSVNVCIAQACRVNNEIIDIELEIKTNLRWGILSLGKCWIRNKMNEKLEILEALNNFLKLGKEIDKSIIKYIEYKEDLESLMFQIEAGINIIEGIIIKIFYINLEIKEMKLRE